MFPSRCCEEETWKTATIRLDGECPKCIREKQEREKGADVLSRLMGAEPAGTRMVYACQHERIKIKGDRLQDCFTSDAYSAPLDCIDEYQVTEAVNELQLTDKIPPPEASKQKTQLGNAAPAKPLQGSVDPGAERGDKELADFVRMRKNLVFSWELHRLLQLNRERHLVPCPECRRNFESQITGTRGEAPASAGPRFRSRKPKGLQITTEDIQVCSGIEAVRASTPKVELLMRGLRKLRRRQAT
jgi:hypothetical protein